MIAYPTPHYSKLKATLESGKLPSCDRSQVVQAMERYREWIADLDKIIEADGPEDLRLQKMVDLLNQYRLYIEIDLILNSQSGWLYRQKGQIKLDNSIIEEFLPRLVRSCLKSELSLLDVTIGPTTTFSSVWFNSSPKRPGSGGGLNIRTKDHDFAISRPLRLNATDASRSVTSTEMFNLAYVAAECKTNLDKTMFQEACASASDLKSAVPGAKYFILCEWLDMTPISSSTSPVDKVFLLRKSKRPSAEMRALGVYGGQQAARETYINFLVEHPYKAEVFGTFIDCVRDVLTYEPIDQATALEQGYF